MLGGVAGFGPVLHEILGFLGCSKGSAVNTCSWIDLLSYFLLNHLISPQSRGYMAWAGSCTETSVLLFKNIPVDLPENLMDVAGIPLRWGCNCGSSAENPL